jgi:hypothetical protein
MLKPRTLEKMTRLLAKPADDILGMLRDGRHFSERRGAHIHIVDSHTGESRYIFLAESANVPTEWKKLPLPSGETCFLQEQVNPSVLVRREVHFSEIVVDQMCSRIVEQNRGLTDICKDDDMPSYTTLCAWRRVHPWIDERLEVARRDRAERLRDEAFAIVDQVTDAKEVPAASLRADLRKWAAGVDNTKYSPKAKVEANINLPTQINVITGISKEPLPDTQAPPPTERDVNEPKS